MPKLVVNILLFQAGWFACVLGGAHSLPWLGPTVVALVLAWYLYTSNDKSAEVKLILSVTMIGCLFDQALLSAGYVRYPQSVWPPYLLPVWMMALWVVFSTTLNISLRWMRQHYYIAILFGIIGGPLAYLSGEKLGAMMLNQPMHTFLFLAIGWGVMMPVFIWLATTFDKVDNKREHLQRV